ncbi:MAG: hypothetical protein ETSY1_17500 [Candidatus Entotheonella factor]|uniref:SpoVT-AbrB domain-containing protein n=1 Tax=Entotheonella factor TaxID=1429438 RepID=W4LLA2_ENTF1|nr:MAG: hypothetical protein ETSY1_17500 [Candidatus Entotheonella factor]
MQAKVAERGQVTIPKALRERLGIQPGTILEFTEEAGRLIAVKTDQQDALDRVYGTIGQGRHTDAILEELRGSTS